MRGVEELYLRLHGADQRAAVAAARALGGAGRGPVAVSACLLGVRCRYDGCDARDAGVVAGAAEVPVLPLCPEMLAGLGVPRAPVAFDGDGGGDAVLAGQAAVRDAAGRDVTKRFVTGARRADTLARAAGVAAAWLKERSPSCGVQLVHRATGGPRTRLVPGRGVLTALLAARGVDVLGKE